MSGASGKVLAAIQVTPEAVNNGAIGKIRDGDIVVIDADKGELSIETDGDTLEDREQPPHDLSQQHFGMGRELFSAFRQQISGAEAGATLFSEIN